MKWIFSALLAFFFPFFTNAQPSISKKRTDIQIYQALKNGDLRPGLAAFNMSIIGHQMDAESLEPDIRIDSFVNDVLVLEGETCANYILSNSNSRILQFGVSHHKPYQLSLIDNLLDSLYSKGYRYLAMEALTNHFLDSMEMIMDVEMENRGYPLFSRFSGSYLRDPTFSNLVRKAIGLGFKLVGYESVQQNRKTREKRQAENIYRKVFLKDKKAKVVIISGYFHAFEKEHVGRKWMASYLPELTGINPFTVYLDYKHSNEYWKGKDVSFLNNEPCVGFVAKANNYCDMFIEFKCKKDYPNYPEYDILDIIDISILEKMEFPLIISIFAGSDEPSATPLDIIQLNSIHNHTKITIPKFDSYFWKIVDSDELHYFSLEF